MQTKEHLILEDVYNQFVLDYCISYESKIGHMPHWAALSVSLILLLLRILQGKVILDFEEIHS